MDKNRSGNKTLLKGVRVISKVTCTLFIRGSVAGEDRILAQFYCRKTGVSMQVKEMEIYDNPWPKMACCFWPRI